MNKTKHTPGPWTKDSALIRGTYASIIAQSTTSKAKCIIAHIDSPLGKGEAEANAHLIAAAPELLNACKLAQGLLDGLAMANIYRLGTVYNDLTVIIAKAEGK